MEAGRQSQGVHGPQKQRRACPAPARARCSLRTSRGGAAASSRAEAAAAEWMSRSGASVPSPLPCCCRDESRSGGAECSSRAASGAALRRRSCAPSSACAANPSHGATRSCRPAPPTSRVRAANSGAASLCTARLASAALARGQTPRRRAARQGGRVIGREPARMLARVGADVQRLCSSVVTDTSEEEQRFTGASLLQAGRRRTKNGRLTAHARSWWCISDSSWSRALGINARICAAAAIPR